MNDLEVLMNLRESTYALLRLMHKKRSEINEDIKEANELLDAIEVEIRRMIEI